MNFKSFSQNLSWTSLTPGLLLIFVLFSSLIVTPIHGNEASSTTTSSTTKMTNPQGNDMVAIESASTSTPVVPTTTTTTESTNPFFNKLNRIFDGTRVGPFWLFRSSKKNAEIVKEAFKFHPILRTLGLAFGDEFPHLRDDLARQHQPTTKIRTPPPLANTFERTVGALAKMDNWRYDMQNDRIEMEQPFYRHQRGNWVNSLLDRWGGHNNRFGNNASWRSGVTIQA